MSVITATMSEHDSTTPTDAVELYLETRANELADSTYRSQKCRLERFAEWCDENGVETLDQLGGKHLQEYRIFLRDHYTQKDGSKGVSPLTIRTRLCTVRVFLRFAASIDAVEPTLAERMVLPTVDREQRYREEIIDSEDAKDTLDALRANRYGEKAHVVFELLWQTGCRLGGVHSLDIDDVDEDNQWIELHHRPDEGTTLKNEERGERYIAVTEQLLEIIDQYIQLHRIPVTDEYGREPLLTTEHGRPDKSTLRNWAYLAQLPCYQRNVCPHDEDIASCEKRRVYGRDECPSTTMPHNIRRGRITDLLSQDVPKRAVSDRVDVAGDILDTHYDQRSEAGKAEQRRNFFT
ncbi:tyrosine-type recombinase/integrase [Haloplanus halobius]|uniref:tyrosine-type recombinase/integrase n=1 Tax=Haloplanus halobius TaxID=2934938 RepID=UPI00200EC7D7|nr:site-specific integrase [Haloplanus sp. XH21]